MAGVIASDVNVAAALSLSSANEVSKLQAIGIGVGLFVAVYVPAFVTTALVVDGGFVAK